MATPEDLEDYQHHIEGRGIYDERNRVNDLTGREWKYATKSVIPKGYPPDMQHDRRSEHGGQKPPRLCAELIGRFSKAGDRVLDPFAGVGGTLLGASLCAHEGTGLREAVGFERVERWVECYEAVLEAENAERRERGEPPLDPQTLRQGDCLELVEELATDSIDCLVTDVPYWTMDSREQTRNERRTRDSKLSAFDPDAEQSSKEEWLADLGAAFAAFERVLREGAYAVVFIGDMYREQSYEFLSADLAREIQDSTGLTLRANLVWYDPTKDLHVYGYPYAFVPSMVHQNVLVFRAD